MMLRDILLLTVALACTACGTSRSDARRAASRDLPPLQKEQVWQLVAVQGRAVGRGAEPITLIFNPETGALRGQAHCNSYSADYTLVPADDGGCTLVLSALTSGDIQCPEAPMNAERRYLALLRRADRMVLDDAGTTLSLLQQERTLLIYELQ